MVHLILVRHGTRDDTDHPEKYLGKSHNNDCPLSENGFLLCQKKGAELVQILDQLKIPEITHLIYSPFLRTQQTAEEYQKFFPSAQLSSSWEVSEGQNHFAPELEEKMLAEMKAVGIEFPETKENILARCGRFLERVLKEYDSSDVVMVSTHGIIYNSLLQHLVPGYTYRETTKADEYVPRYCDTTVLTWAPESRVWQVRSSDLEDLS